MCYSEGILPGNSQDPIYVGTVYSNSKRVDCFPGGLPLNEWVGLKFKVNTVPDTSDVLLELWVDYNNDGQWELGLSYTDTVGSWPCSTSKVVPSACSQSNGDTVTRPGNVSFLRTDGEDTTTEVHWRDVTITNSVVSLIGIYYYDFIHMLTSCVLIFYRLPNRCALMELKAQMAERKSVVHHLVDSVGVVGAAHSLEGRVYVALGLL